MSKRDEFLLVEDMMESASKILRYSKGLSYQEFVNDDKTIDAIIRNFEIIGEASARISIPFKEKFSDIEWRKLKGFRNRLIHEYFGVDHKIVWNIIQNELQELIFGLNKILDTKN